MSKKTKRIYVDSTVVSGMFDCHMPDRVEQARQFWDSMQRGDFVVIASDVLEEEQEEAPQQVRDFFDGLPESLIEHVVSTNESDRLAMRYITENVIGTSSLDDCRHIAVATIVGADAIVSWNLRDMVNRDEKYKSVNRMLGYPDIEIITPNKFMEANHDKH